MKCVCGVHLLKSNAFVFSLSYNNRWPARLHIFSFLSDAAFDVNINMMRTNVLVLHYWVVFLHCSQHWILGNVHLSSVTLWTQWHIRLTYTKKRCMMEISLLPYDTTLNQSLSDCNDLLNWTRLLNERFPWTQNNKRPVVEQWELLGKVTFKLPLLWDLKGYDLVLGVLNNRFTCMRGFNMHLHFSTTLKRFVQRFIS